MTGSRRISSPCISASRTAPAPAPCLGAHHSPEHLSDCQPSVSHPFLQRLTCSAPGVVMPPLPSSSARFTSSTTIRRPIRGYPSIKPRWVAFLSPVGSELAEASYQSTCLPARPSPATTFVQRLLLLLGRVEHCRIVSQLDPHTADN
eukprot:scaffold263_cov251-Pinguiococcus_pyrenoidosus.AAC.7